MFVSGKKLRIIALVSISILVIAFAFAAISFTNSSTLARSNRQKQTGQDAYRTTIYRTPAIIIAGSSDINKINIRNNHCDVIGVRNINDIIPIWTTKTDNGDSNYEILTCSIDNDKSLPFFRLADDFKTNKGFMPQYISSTNLYLIIDTDTVTVSEVFNEYKATVSKQQPKIYDDKCNKINSKKLKQNSVVTLSNPITTKWCQFGNNQQYYVVKIQYNNNTYYVAIEDLKPINRFNR
jgi:hypothetical protein